MNPARSFAPDLARGDMSTTWIYVLGPVLGAIIAVGFEWVRIAEGSRCLDDGV
jgi:aquaporin Z